MAKYVCPVCGYVYEGENPPAKCPICGKDMVKEESESVKFNTTSVENDAKIELPAPKTYADKVTFTWTVTGDCAAIADGKLVITLPKKSTTVTLTLEIVCGEAKDVKTFEIAVNVPVYSINVVTSPVADKAYKLYFFQGGLNKGFFMDGGIGSKEYYLSSTTESAKGVDAYLVAVDGGYNLKIVTAAGETKYINIVLSGTYVNSLIQDTATTVYTFNTEFNTLVANVNGADWLIATDKTFDTVSAKKTTYTGLYIVNLVEVVCNHDYTSDCDTVCDYCGATREAPAAHTYTDDCDTTCDCGATRTAPHKYVSDCDTTCDCGATRTTEVDHKWEDECDEDCVICFEKREAPHKYATDCDTTCDCGATREALAAHTYADECDDTCDCGATRTAPHKYTAECDDTCDCGATREASAHTYGNCDDTDCNVCGATRDPVDHAYSSVCDTTCNNCGEERVAEQCKDTNGDNICDNDGCGKEMGSDGPMTDVVVNN